MRGVRLSKEELQQKFPLSNRMVVRVGALLAKKVDLSAAVLELATPGSAMERLLLSPQILTHADTLSTKRFGELIAKLDVPPDVSLAVHAEGGWRTILLEEELLAEKGWQDAAPEPSRLPAQRRPAGLTAQPPVSPTLFSAEDIERIKMDALTAADPAQKAASLRRLSLAPISEQEKASVFFRVLVDPVAQGRAEAISGLQALGFDADAANALRDLLEGKPQTRTMAVERITGLLGRLGEAHAAIVVGVLLEILRETDAPDLQQNLLLALREAGPLLAQKEDYAQEAVRLALRAVQLNYNRLASPARGILTELGRQESEKMAHVLWQELDRIRNHRVRVFVLSVLAQIGPPARLRKEAAAAMAEEIMEPSTPESERLLLGHSLAAMGDEAVAPLLTALNAKRSEQKPFLIPFLDMLCQGKGISAAAKNQIARTTLARLKVEDRRVRLSIVQARLCSDPSVEAPLRRAIADELIKNLNEFDHPDVRERIEVNLERIGEPAIAPLFEFVKRHPMGTHSDPRKNFTDHLARILAQIIARATEAAKKVHAQLPPVLDFCIERIKDDRVQFGGYAEAAALLCAQAPMGPERGKELIALLLDRLPVVAYPASVIAALGTIAGANPIELRHKIEVIHILLRIIGARRSAPVAEIKETPTGVIYEFGKDADLDALMLPAAVVGAGKICVSDSASPALRQMIIEHLLSAWRQATSWRVTWGPLSTEQLARTLGMLGSYAHTSVELKLQIARALKDQAAHRLSAVRAMGEICSQPEKVKDLDEVGLEFAQAIMEAWLGPETEPEERRIVLTTLARIAARNELDRRSPRVKTFRERVLELVFDAFRDRFDGARTLLEILSQCPAFTKAQRNEIEERLRSFYAVTKI